MRLYLRLLTIMIEKIHTFLYINYSFYKKESIDFYRNEYKINYISDFIRQLLLACQYMYK